MHPHSDRRHIMISYRRYIIGEKNRIAGLTNTRNSFRKGARGLIHYMDYIHEYLQAKRDVMHERKNNNVCA